MASYQLAWLWLHVHSFHLPIMFSFNWDQNSLILFLCFTLFKNVYSISILSLLHELELALESLFVLFRLSCAWHLGSKQCFGIISSVIEFLFPNFSLSFSLVLVSFGADKCEFNSMWNCYPGNSCQNQWSFVQIVVICPPNISYLYARHCKPSP